MCHKQWRNIYVLLFLLNLQDIGVYAWAREVPKQPSMDQFTFNVAKDTQEPVAVDHVEDFSKAGLQIDNTMENEQLHDDM